LRMLQISIGLLMPSLKAVRRGTGIHLRYGEVQLALDTGIPGLTTLLSHAHSDHIGDLHLAKQVITTQETLDALAARGEKVTQEIRNVRYNETLGQIGAYITPLNAGHVIGSAMFKIEFDDGLSVLYTGDFNAVDSIVHVAAEPVHADVLITEATYGTPQWIFPDRSAIHHDIVNTAKRIIEQGRIPIFRAYSLGKAQEAIALLQNANIEVLSGNQAIDAVCEVYNRYGVELHYSSLESKRARNSLQEGCAVVTSAARHAFANVKKMLGKSFARDLERRKETFNLSGWTLGEYKNGGFPLSAHTDFPGLLKFAEAVEPRIAYCFTDNAGVLSSHLAKKGINAVPLE
jgi:Cft2 family RNA processing exonuclease